MTGVEILATSECATSLEPNSFAFILVFAFCIFLGIALGFKDKEYGLGALMGGMVGVAADFWSGCQQALQKQNIIQPIK